jgi:hypothetical protein
MTDFCPACQCGLRGVAAREAHNLECATTGERAYPKFPALILPSGKPYDPARYRDPSLPPKRSYIGRRTS